MVLSIQPTVLEEDKSARRTGSGQEGHPPSLPDSRDWDAYETARQALGPNLSHRNPAPRYGLTG